MTIFSVSNASELATAITKARSGDTIELASGTYNGVAIRDLNFDKAITITSADAKAPAEITGLVVRNSSGVAFTNLTLADKDSNTLYDFSVYNSAKVSFDHVLIKGQDGSAGYNSAPMMIRNSQDVSVTNSEITHARYGINMLNNSGLTLTGNYFHDLRTDGIRGGGNSNVAISKNFFTDFHPEAGDHPDAIQFWTTNQTASASNIAITDNVVLRGEGSPIQGIFMRDEVGNLPYKNVSISGNLIVGGLYNGISVSNAEDLSVLNNSVAGYIGQKSWISINRPAKILGNNAELYILGGVNQSTAPTGNESSLAVYDGGSALLASWLLEHPDALALFSSSAVFADPYAEMTALATAAPPPVPVSTITGTSGADRLKAAAVGDSILIGGAGNDTLTGGVGNTRMEGGSGDDIYYVNSTRDKVIELAGGGTDTAYASINYSLADNVETLRLAASGLTVHGNNGDNRIVGSAETDTIYGEAGNDSIQGLDGNDILDGGFGDDSLSGGAGDDKLYAGDGNDGLSGGDGNDMLWGSAGDDTLEGGPGNDVLSGGTGKDMFLFRPADVGGYDVITDFSSAQGDRIGLSLIDAKASTAFNEAFRFIGTAAFGHAEGELRYSAQNGGILVQGDINGDGIADLSIMLANVNSVAAYDFIL